MIKKIFLRIGIILINLGIIFLLWHIGWRAILGCGIGILIGASVVLYWEYSRNSYLSYILKDCLIGQEKGGKNGK